MNINDLMQQRAQALAEMRNFHDSIANGEDRQAEYDRASAEFDRISNLITEEKRIADAERTMGEVENVVRTNPKDERMKLFARALGGEMSDIAAFRNAYSLGDNSQAGYLTAPVEFFDQLIKGLDASCFMRAISHKTPTIGKAASLGFPYIATDATDAEWKTEVAAAGEESTLAFGRREFKPYRMAKMVKVSRTLMNHSTLAPEVILERMRTKIAETQEKAYLSGDGSSKPLGVFTASTSGISTARDVTAAKATSLGMADFYDAKYTLAGQYHNRASWVMHRDVVKMVAKLKDNDGQYLWQPSTQAGQPDRLLGLPVYMSEFAPNTITAGNYVAICGDFSYYWICDADTLEMQVLKELYATTNQNGYIFNYFGDGMPVCGDAFARLKMGASD